MLDGAVLDVAIGMLLLFLVASLVASAIVETVGGLLHRRSKHLWDTLDLLLGNTSTTTDGMQSIVSELYTQPFITGLVRPTDRLRFNPRPGDASRAPVAPRKLPWRGRARKNMQTLPMAASGTIDESALRRRFYGPNNIDAREFTNALLSYLRPGGAVDDARTALSEIAAAMSEDATTDESTTTTTTDVAVSAIGDAVARLTTARESLGSREFADAIDDIAAARESIGAADLRAALAAAENALTDLVSGPPTKESVEAALRAVPRDLRVKLSAVADEVGDQVTDLRDGIEQWYDRNMAAASAWYRKQTRYFLFIAGLAMAATLNIDAVHATTTLFRDESVRSALVAAAEQVGGLECDGGGAAATAEPEPAQDDAVPADTEPAPDAAAPAISIDCLRDNVDSSLVFPVGWSDIDASPGGWALRVLGWIFVAAGVTLGAPFWFDLLGRALRRKASTGK